MLVNNGPMPEELKGWNWGAFLLTWIWSIAHNVWIGLIALVSGAHLVMAIILGLKGNEWAWENRQFRSVQEFKEVQAAWTKWGIIATVGIIVIVIVLSIVFVLLQYALINWVIQTPQHPYP